MHRLHLYAIKVTDHGASVIENLTKNPDPVRQCGKFVIVPSKERRKENRVPGFSRRNVGKLTASLNEWIEG